MPSLRNKRDQTCNAATVGGNSWCKLQPETRVANADQKRSELVAVPKEREAPAQRASTRARLTATMLRDAAAARQASRGVPTVAAGGNPQRTSKVVMTTWQDAAFKLSGLGHGCSADETARVGAAYPRDARSETKTREQSGTPQSCSRLANCARAKCSKSKKPAPAKVLATRRWSLSEPGQPARLNCTTQRATSAAQAIGQDKWIPLQHPTNIKSRDAHARPRAPSCGATRRHGKATSASARATPAVARTPNEPCDERPGVQRTGTDSRYDWRGRSDRWVRPRQHGVTPLVEHP